MNLYHRSSRTQTVFNTLWLITLFLFLSSESVYESAAKLLFMSIKWARSVPSFLQLQEGDQTMLLEDSWAQLFIIGLAQWAIQFDEGMY